MNKYWLWKFNSFNNKEPKEVLYEVYKPIVWLGDQQYHGSLYPVISTFKWLTSNHENSQADVGMRRQHVDVVLTQWVDDDGFAPVNQVNSNLKDLRGKIVFK